jgi:N-acetylglucosaminyldiphosphoundecaprenol N-acetyl-beta-D-mannosaminyltransferase
MCSNIKQKKMERSRPQFSVLGLPVHILDDYAGWLMERLHQGLGSHVVTLNAEMAMQAEQNPALAMQFALLNS